MITDILIMLGLVAAWLLLSPCSPWTVWKGAACGWKAKAKDKPADVPPTG